MANVDEIQELQAEVDELAQRSLHLGEEIKADKKLLKDGCGDVTADEAREQMNLARYIKAKTDAELDDKKRQLKWLTDYHSANPS